MKQKTKNPVNSFFQYDIEFFPSCVGFKRIPIINVNCFSSRKLMRKYLKILRKEHLENKESLYNPANRLVSYDTSVTFGELAFFNLKKKKKTLKNSKVLKKEYKGEI